VTFSEEYTGFH